MKSLKEKCIDKLIELRKKINPKFKRQPSRKIAERRINKFIKTALRKRKTP